MNAYDQIFISQLKFKLEMENYLDSSLTAEPKNVNLDTNSIVDGISCFGFLVSLIYLIKSSSATLYFLFVISIVSIHTILFVKSVFPHFNVEKDIAQRLVLCSDFHYLTIAILFFISKVCPYSYIVLYILLFAVRAFSFVVNKIIPLTNAKNNSIVDAINEIITNPLFIKLPSYVEIILAIQLLINAIIDFRLMTWVSCIAYAFWILIFNFANNEVHSKIWTSASIWLREYAAKNAETFGPQLETAVDKITEFANVVAQFYPTRELKVHLQ